MPAWKSIVLLLALFALSMRCAAAAEPPVDFESCEALLTAQPEAEESAACFYSVGRETGAITEGAARLRRLLARSPEHPWLSLNLGHLLSLSEETQEAAAAYRKAAEASAARRNPRGEVIARSNLQRIFMDLGRMEEAGREAERAERVAEASGDAELIARSKVVRARHLFFLGQDLERVHLLLRRAQEFAFPDGPYSLRRECLTWLGNVSLELGRLREAQGYFQRLADLSAREGDAYAEASARYNLARAYLDGIAESPRPGDQEQAIALARQALTKAAQAQNSTNQAKSHWLLGLLLTGEEARSHLDRCLQVADTIRDRSYCLNALARHLAVEDPQRAREATQEALALAHRAEDSWGMAYAWRERMRASWASGSREQAIADSRAALEAIETLRDLQDGSEGRVGLFSTWSDDYSWFSGRLLETQRQEALEGAFEVIERKRARVLLDALGIAQASPALPALRAPAFATLAQVRASLAPDEALLSFQIALDHDVFGDFAGGSWVVVSTREGTRAWRLRLDRLALRPAVELFNGLFSRRDGSEAGPAAGLYRELLADALGSLPAGVRRLVIIPDDSLHLLPFAALRDSATAAPLIARFELSMVPSATLWLHWRGQDHTAAPAPLLALADPIPPGGGRGAPQAAVTREPAAVFDDTIRLGSLPFARREGRAAVRHLGGGSHLRIGEDASEGFLKQADLRRFGILHFATHAVLDAQNPERSGVLLTPAPAGEDGLLQIREIVPLALDGRIVVLSSCRSASGTVLRGEGVMGLARAFFQAGAHTVVASLWPLRDDDGAALFDRFYDHLAQGKSVSAALRAAQLDRIADGAPGYAWAGLVVLGEGDFVPMPGGRPETPVARWIWIAGGGAGVLLLLAGALILARR